MRRCSSEPTADLRPTPPTRIVLDVRETSNEMTRCVSATSTAVRVVVHAPASTFSPTYSATQGRAAARETARPVAACRGTAPHGSDMLRRHYSLSRNSTREPAATAAVDDGTAQTQPSPLEAPMEAVRQVVPGDDLDEGLPPVIPFVLLAEVRGRIPRPRFLRAWYQLIGGLRRILTSIAGLAWG